MGGEREGGRPLCSPTLPPPPPPHSSPSPPPPPPTHTPDKQTFPDLDVVGWYAASTAPGAPLASVLHTAATAAAGGGDAGAACVGLLFDPDAPLASGAVGNDALPLTLVEPADGAAPGAPPRFGPADFTIHASDAERIAVQHAARASAGGADGGSGGGNALVAHYRALHGAVAALASRVDSLHASIAAAATNPAAPLDHARARAAAGLLARLPVPGGEDGRGGEGAALAALLLAAATRGVVDAGALGDAVASAVAAGPRRSGRAGAAVGGGFVL